jgi:hypothetical protein
VSQVPPVVVQSLPDVQPEGQLVPPPQAPLPVQLVVQPHEVEQSMLLAQERKPSQVMLHAPGPQVMAPVQESRSLQPTVQLLAAPQVMVPPHASRVPQVTEHAPDPQVRLPPQTPLLTEQSRVQSVALEQSMPAAQALAPVQ